MKKLIVSSLVVTMADLNLNGWKIEVAGTKCYHVYVYNIIDSSRQYFHVPSISYRNICVQTCIKIEIFDGSSARFSQVRMLYRK